MTATLSQMVDIALGTPEVGAVNFNVLHTLLHALLSKLDIEGVKADLGEFDRYYVQTGPQKSLPEDGDDSRSIADSGVTGFTEHSDKDRPSTTPAAVVGSRHHSYHQLESKVVFLDEQLRALNDLPSNSDLFTRASSEGEKSRPVSEMWQNMQLSKRVGANEEGVNKLMSLVEDLMKELCEVKKSNEQLKKQMEECPKASALQDILDKMAALEKTSKELGDQMRRLESSVPSADLLSDFVQWAALEDALRGLREQLEDLPGPGPERVVIEAAIQTDTQSRPASSRRSTPGPSAELQDLLSNLGLLTDRHDKLDSQVQELEEELKDKADRGDLAGLGASDELLSKIKDLQDEIAAVRKSQSKDSEGLLRLQQAIVQLQRELERISNTAQDIIDQNNNKQKDIDNLYELYGKLEENKAGQEMVQTELELKADKLLLDSKVNRSLFDQTCDELNRMMTNLLSKLGGQEEDWKKLMDQFSADLDGKLDRLEFGPIREELERQIKSILNKLNSLRFGDLEDDAAGLRKQLLQKFHCISCDRPVDMMSHGPIPSIPAPTGLPATRSTRPYTTFELEQIRQQAKNPGPAFLDLQTSTAQQIDLVDLYQTSRSCGGSHTLTYPYRRITKVTQLNNLFRDEEVILPGREETEIQGADGHMYKGGQTAGDEMRFPAVQTPNNPPPSKSPTVSRKLPKPPGGEASPRPQSSRLRVMSPTTRRPPSVPRLHSSREDLAIPTGPSDHQEVR